MSTIYGDVMVLCAQGTAATLKNTEHPIATLMVEAREEKERRNGVGTYGHTNGSDSDDGSHTKTFDNNKDYKDKDRENERRERGGTIGTIGSVVSSESTTVAGHVSSKAPPRSNTVDAEESNNDITTDSGSNKPTITTGSTPGSGNNNRGRAGSMSSQNSQRNRSRTNSVHDHVSAPGQGMSSPIHSRSRAGSISDGITIPGSPVMLQDVYASLHRPDPLQSLAARRDGYYMGHRRLRRNPRPCSSLHVPYARNTAPFSFMRLVPCMNCGRKWVPETVIATVAPMPSTPMRGGARLLEARVCRSRKGAIGEQDAVKISEVLPFVEYDLQRQLQVKLKVVGMNALFDYQAHIQLSKSLIIMTATCTAVYVEALPPPPTIVGPTQQSIGSLPVDTQELYDRALNMSSVNRNLLQNQMTTSGGRMWGLHRRRRSSSSSSSSESSSSSSDDSDMESTSSSGSSGSDSSSGSSGTAHSEAVSLEAPSVSVSSENSFTDDSDSSSSSSSSEDDYDPDDPKYADKERYAERIARAARKKKRKAEKQARRVERERLRMQRRERRAAEKVRRLRAPSLGGGSKSHVVEGESLSHGVITDSRGSLSPHHPMNITGDMTNTSLLDISDLTLQGHRSPTTNMIGMGGSDRLGEAEIEGATITSTHTMKDYDTQVPLTLDTADGDKMGGRGRRPAHQQRSKLYQDERLPFVLELDEETDADLAAVLMDWIPDEPHCALTLEEQPGLGMRPATPLPSRKEEKTKLNLPLPLSSVVNPTTTNNSTGFGSGTGARIMGVGLGHGQGQILRHKCVPAYQGSVGGGLLVAVMNRRTLNRATYHLPGELNRIVAEIYKQSYSDLIKKARETLSRSSDSQEDGKEYEDASQLNRRLGSTDMPQPVAVAFGSVKNKTMDGSSALTIPPALCIVGLKSQLSLVHELTIELFTTATVFPTATSSSTIPLMLSAAPPLTNEVTPAPISESASQREISTLSISQSSKPVSSLDIHSNEIIPDVILTPLSYLTGCSVERYLGPIQLYFLKESWSIRRPEDLQLFQHRFLSEVNQLVCAHVAALGGNALLCMRIRTLEHGGKLIGAPVSLMVLVTGDVVHHENVPDIDSGN
jgi:hypothetical protein